MSSSDDGNVGQWLAGILAVIVSGVVVLYLTERHNPPSPTADFQQPESTSTSTHESSNQEGRTFNIDEEPEEEQESGVTEHRIDCKGVFGGVPARISGIRKLLTLTFSMSKPIGAQPSSFF